VVEVDWLGEDLLDYYLLQVVILEGEEDCLGAD
jgi:hypothetical protein